MIERKRQPRDGEPKVHGSVSLRNAKLGRFTELKERVQFWDSELGDYSYIERHAEVIYARIGKFCALASGVCWRRRLHKPGPTWCRIHTATTIASLSSWPLAGWSTI